MSKELNCMNCCIGDFKNNLCDCDNGICKEYKKVGRAEDFESEVLNRTKPKTGQWIDEGFYADGHGAHAFRCSECGGHIIEYDADPFCKWCGAKMEIEESEEADLDYERAVMEHQHNMLYEPTFNPEDGSM